MNVGVAGSAPAFKVGDSVTLVRNENGVKTDDIQYGKIQQGVSLNYNLKGMTGSDGKSVNAVVTDKAATNNPIVASMGGQRTHIESGSYSVVF